MDTPIKENKLAFKRLDMNFEDSFLANIETTSSEHERDISSSDVDVIFSAACAAEYDNFVETLLASFQ